MIQSILTVGIGLVLCVGFSGQLSDDQLGETEAGCDGMQVWDESFVEIQHSKASS